MAKHRDFRYKGLVAFGTGHEVALLTPIVLGMVAQGSWKMPFVVRARWDNEASVWWAESDDIIGLVAEADSMDLLKQQLTEIVPELLRLNSQQACGPIDIHLIAESQEDLSIAA